MNFREASQPQYANTFTIDVCSSSRLLTQYHKFCAQRAEAHLSGATQSSNENTIGVSGKYDSDYCKKSLRSNRRLRLCSLRRIIGTAMLVRGVERKTMADSFDDWLLKNYTNFVKQNDDSSARNKIKP